MLTCPVCWDVLIGHGYIDIKCLVILLHKLVMTAVYGDKHLMIKKGYTLVDSLDYLVHGKYGSTEVKRESVCCRER